MTLVILVVIMIILFGLAFVRKRRFGVLGLALAAGVLLSQNAAGFVGSIYQTNLLPVAPLTYEVAASITLILLPALLLLIKGPSYMEKRSAILGAVGFALLGTLLILGPLTTALPTLDSGVKDALDLIAQWQGVLVAVGISAAILDTILLHSAKSSGSKHAKH